MLRLARAACNTKPSFLAPEKGGARLVQGNRAERCDLPGRAFRFEKLTPGTDDEESAYSVFVADERGRDCCDCKGFARHGHCKHVSAVRDGLLFNEWI